MYSVTKVLSGSAPTLYNFSIPAFYGVDYFNDRYKCAPGRASEGSKNFIRRRSGVVAKWPGWQTVKKFDGRINGYHRLDEKSAVWHIGDGYFIETDKTVASEPAWRGADGLSFCIKAYSKLWILDGYKYIYFDGETVEPVENIAHIPTALTGCDPASGAGTQYEGLNLLSSKYKIEFIGDGETVSFQLPNPIPETAEVRVWQRSLSGTLAELEPSGINHAAGVVSLAKSYPTPAAGYSNIIIQSEYENLPERINRCTTACLFGAGGNRERLFVGGYGHEDHYSAFRDFTMFSELSSFFIGDEGGDVMCYSLVGGYLATHKKEDGDNTNTYLRSGVLDEKGEISFSLVGNYQGAGAYSRYTTCYGNTEPMYLSEDGIYSLSRIQNSPDGMRRPLARSERIAPLIRAIEDKESAVAVFYDDFYMLFADGRIYALDTTQQENGSYECFIRDNVDACCAWVEDGELYFGTPDGHVRVFKNAGNELACYEDDNSLCAEGDVAAVEMSWNSNVFTSGNFAADKTFVFFDVLLGAFPTTGVNLTAEYSGKTETIFDYDASFNYLDFEALDFEYLTFSGDDFPQSQRSDREIICKSIRFSLVNDKVQPCMLYGFTAKYILGV